MLSSDPNNTVLSKALAKLVPNPPNPSYDDYWEIGDINTKIPDNIIDAICAQVRVSYNDHSQYTSKWNQWTGNFDPLPASRIGNKARIYPDAIVRKMTSPQYTIDQSMDPRTIHASGSFISRPIILPQYVNDSLKPIDQRFKYFEKPVQSYYTEDYLYNSVDAALMDDLNRRFHQMNTDINGYNKGSISYIPTDALDIKWHNYNKQYIDNRIKNGGCMIGGEKAIVDPNVLKALKKIYPEASEHVLRKDYDALAAINGLYVKDGRVIHAFPPSASVNNKPSVLNIIRTIIEPARSVQELDDIIYRTVYDISLDALIVKYTSINITLLRRNSIIYKLAYVAGSTNETISIDGPKIERIVMDKYASLRIH